MEPTNAKFSSNPTVDVNDTGINKLVIVTYTWTNTGTSDTIRVNEASSWKIEFDTSLEVQDLQSYYKYNDINDPKAGGEPTDWRIEYYTEVFGSAYTSLSEEETVLFHQNHEPPPLSVRYPRTICKIKTYSSYLYSLALSSALGRINAYDFLPKIFEVKEAALVVKNKNSSYDYCDYLINGDDTGRWLFLDFTIGERSNALYEYNFSLEYKYEGWNVDHGITTNKYPAMDFYTFFSGMDNVAPNEREER